MMNDMQHQALNTRNTHLEAEVEQLRTSLELLLHLGKILDLQQFMTELAISLTRYTHFERTLVLLMDEAGSALRFGAISEPLREERMNLLRQFVISTYNRDANYILRSWRTGDAVEINATNAGDTSPLPGLVYVFDRAMLYTVPLITDGHLVGVIIAQYPSGESSAFAADGQFVLGIAPTIAITLENARLHSKTVDELDAKMRQLYMLRQLDHELNETINLDLVFDMTVDWALRYTGGQAASLAVYDDETSELRYVADIGYSQSKDQLAALRAQKPMTTAHRAARHGRPEVIPDVTIDPDYLRLSPSICSQLCAPIMREDRVIAVIVVESKRINAFNEEHIAFVRKLGARAGVAIDNARLFAEAVRQREKLSRILSNTADVVIVVNGEGKVDLINESAQAALLLKPGESYMGRAFEPLVRDTPLYDIYQRAVSRQQETIAEVLLPNERTFHANFAYYEGVGWIIVMHDITPLKETDRLKTELVATVSHDLKQPLSVMQGYVELLLMGEWREPEISIYTQMLQRAVANMRQLIDDILDMAKIESGVQFEPQPIALHEVIEGCVDAVRKAAEAKQMRLSVSIPDELAPVSGERGFLSQIFTNLIGNAVKYTPAGGSVRIWAEPRGDNVRVAIQDSGYGISPEDQARIFDRFYRVRRPENEGIDGTGLGLAIVKRLVEMHNGHIGLVSRLGEGTTFYVTLPAHPDNPQA